jgi:hypothetical protein
LLISQRKKIMIYQLLIHLGGRNTLLCVLLFSVFCKCGMLFHSVHSMHCKWFTNPCNTNKCTVPLLCISLLISSYVLWLNCHHQGADIVLLQLRAIKQLTVLTHNKYIDENIQCLKCYKMLIIRLLLIMIAVVYNCLLASWLLVIDQKWILPWNYRHYAILISKLLFSRYKCAYS